MKSIYLFMLNFFLIQIVCAEVTQQTLTPYLLYQFANHIQKNNDKNHYNIHLVSSDNKLKTKFGKVLNEKKIYGKEIRISQSVNETLPDNLDMIYIAPESSIYFSKISKYIEGKSILLISFGIEDKKNVMLNIFMKSDEKLSFEINRANILNEGFSISDQVVLMGGTELDVAKLFKGAKQSLQENEAILQKQKIQMQKSNEKLFITQKKLNNAQEKLKSLEKKTKKYLEDITKAKKTIDQINTNMLQEKKAYEKQIMKNKTLEEVVLENKKINDQVKAELEKMSEIIEKKNELISRREESLETLNQEINNKELRLKELNNITKIQDEKISTHESTISKQQQILFWVILALVLFVIMGLIILAIYQRLKTTLINLKNTQKELVENEKMASLGKLVAGLAHEINTPLGISVSAISVLKLQVQEIQQKFHDNTLKQSELVKYFDITNEIVESSELSLDRAAKLVKSFKQVSIDQQVEDLREFNLQDYMQTILVSYKNQLKNANINMHIEIPDSLSISSFPGVYYQIFTNLINNSLLHAFSEAKEGNISIIASVDEEMVHLIYKDDGKGVSQKDLAHIFDPFFTTKKAKGGTGLGLHIIYNLITQKLRGRIKSKSKEGEGLTFYIDLPLEINQIA